MTRNLKFHPIWRRTGISAADVRWVWIDFYTSLHIFAGIGENFVNLERLIVSYQQTKFIERSNFRNLAKLEKLYLNHNKIEFLPENVFNDLPNLIRLCLDVNQIKNLPENIFKNLRKLKTISFDINKIEYLPRNLFANNLELERILASRNPLKTIDADFTNIPTLNRLDLTNATCIDFWAKSRTEIVRAQQIINEQCKQN
jgi:Leucine-rich repeat (LRR) protein